MSSAPSDGVWIRGWFDGDFHAINGSEQRLALDVSSTRVVIRRGRLTNIERVEGPPELKASERCLRQDVVPEVLLQGQDSRWIAPLSDLFLLDWEADSTGHVLGGGGARIGRVVGTAYARISDPRQLHKRKQEKPSVDDAAASEPAPPPEEVPSLEADAGVIEPPMQECKLCSWWQAILAFGLVWWMCSFGWACAVVSPLALRCLLSHSVSRASVNSRLRRLETVAVFLLAVGFCIYVLWRFFLDCSGSAVAPLVVLFVLVLWSVRIRRCWLVTLVTWLWVISVAISCSEQGLGCRSLEDLQDKALSSVDEAESKLNQVFRPDQEARDIADYTGQGDGWKRVGVEEVERYPDRFFDCAGRATSKQAPFVIYMGESALFELGKSELNADAAQQLARIGRLIQRYPQAYIAVIGHSDKSPHSDGPEGNLLLSERRAAAVVEWLFRQQYVPLDHIVSMGAGDRYPLVDTPIEFRGNRRVELRVTCPASKK